MSPTRENRWCSLTGAIDSKKSHLVRTVTDSSGARVCVSIDFVPRRWVLLIEEEKE